MGRKPKPMSVLPAILLPPCGSLRAKAGLAQMGLSEVGWSSASPKGVLEGTAIFPSAQVPSHTPGVIPHHFPHSPFTSLSGHTSDSNHLVWLYVRTAHLPAVTVGEAPPGAIRAPKVPQPADTSLSLVTLTSQASGVRGWPGPGERGEFSAGGASPWEGGEPGHGRRGRRKVGLRGGREAERE